MIKKLQNTINKFDLLYPVAGVALIVFAWQLLCVSGIAPSFALPTPIGVLKAFTGAFPQLVQHAGVSLSEAFIGLFFGVVLAFLFAVFMDEWLIVYKMLYPLLVVTQTIPVVAIAPLLVLWLGYGMAPKVVLIVIVCFFPMAVGLLDAFRCVDQDMLNLLKAMGANKLQIFVHAKLPSAMPAFFSGLKIAVSYSVVGAVIAEWLGGDKGLGVYMTRVRNSFAFDKMFAVIFLISIISLILIGIVVLLERWAMPWKYAERDY